jgi:hypothetical protein
LIVTSVLDRTGAAVAIGLVTAAAVLCLIVATAVAPPAAPFRAPAPAGDSAPALDEEQAARVEDIVVGLVTGGADESAVRDLVREAVRLGRGQGRPAP